MRWHVVDRGGGRGNLIRVIRGEITESLRSTFINVKASDESRRKQ